MAKKDNTFNHGKEIPGDIESKHNAKGKKKKEERERRKAFLLAGRFLSYKL